MSDAPNIPKLLKKAIEEKVKVPRKGDGFIHASSLGPEKRRCDKRLQFERLGIDENYVNPNLKVGTALLLGSSTHSVVDDIMQYTGLAVESNVHFWSDRLGLAGTADHIIRENSVPWILEVKTIAADTYGFLRKPQDRHVWQVHAYMLLSGIPRSIIYYIPKGELVQDSPQTYLKRALRGVDDAALRQAIEDFLEKNKKPGSTTTQTTDSIGCQFVVEQDDEITKAIESICTLVDEANSAKKWLDKNISMCDLCPYSKPCWKNLTVSEVLEKKEALDDARHA